MKIEIESKDIESIADRVIEKIKPLLLNQASHESKEAIFTPKTLAKYLSVDTSWVYKAVSNKSIPYFKNGKYIRFKKTSIDKWIAAGERQPILNFKQMQNSRVSS